MPHDPVLVDRLREALVAFPTTERRMFGGIGFMVGGHLAVAASHTGGLMVRCAPADTATLVTRPAAGPVEMRGRAVDGWVRVDGEAVTSPDALAEWVTVGTTYARSLDPRP